MPLVLFPRTFFPSYFICLDSPCTFYLSDVGDFETDLDRTQQMAVEAQLPLRKCRMIFADQTYVS